jgi:hypothetical protein
VGEDADQARQSSFIELRAFEEELRTSVAWHFSPASPMTRSDRWKRAHVERVK